jgi:SAM-dependent methyltransferase
MADVESATMPYGLYARAELQVGVLEALSAARNYNDWIVSLTLPYLGEHPIEIGSGLGDHAEAWLNAGIHRVTVTDIDDTMVRRLKERFDGDLDERVEVLRMDPGNPPDRSHSSLVAVNVLEHIEDDVGALCAAERLVRPGGFIIVFAPAHQHAMSSFDRSIGHVRRYSLDSMRSVFDSAGLEIEVVRYINAPGLLAWIVGMKWLRLVPSDGIGLRTWDRLVVPLTRRVESHVRMPFGQSVLAVGRNPS